jgi:hypothetical protein
MNHMGRTSKGPSEKLKKPAELQAGEWTFAAEEDAFYLRLAEGEDLAALVHHLRESGELNAGLMLRALLSGRTNVFTAALVELTGLPSQRVAALAYGRGAGLDALLTKAEFPAATVPAFRAAVAAMTEVGAIDTQGVARLQRGLVERVLAQCESGATSAHDPLLVLLRRFAVEAAREDARLFCDDAATEIDAQRFVAMIEQSAPLADDMPADERDEDAIADDRMSEDSSVEGEAFADAESYFEDDEGEFFYESDFDDYAPMDEHYVALNDDNAAIAAANLDAEIALLVRERVAA